MMADHIPVWNKCLSIVEQHVKPQSFKTWFAPIKPLRLDGAVLTIQVPNKFFYEFLEEHYVDILKMAIQKEIGPTARLEYLVPRKPTTNVNPTFKKNDTANKNYKLETNKIKNPFVIPGIQKLKIDSQLNPNYTFESYIAVSYTHLTLPTIYSV